MKIGFVGCSHLGICSAAAAANKNFNVLCFDFNKILIENYKKGILPFYEPGLNQILKKKRKKINFSSEKKDLNSCDLVFISQDTKTSNNNKSDFNDLKILINKTIKNLKKNITLIVMSQAYPGFTESIKWNKKKLYYQVETLIFGKAIHRALNPEQFIIGSSNFIKNKINLNKDYLKYLKKFKCKISLMSYKSAELSKIAINLFLISSISFTNTLAELCEKINADWRDIESILRMDKRIGKFSYIKPGLGIISGNLLRDLNNIIPILNKTGSNAVVVKSWRNHSNYSKKWLMSKISYILNKGYRVGLFGMTYKENTNTLKNSLTVEILKKYKKFKFNIFDPIIKQAPKLNNSKHLSNIDELIKRSDALVILTPWSFLKNYNYQKKLASFKGKVLIDPYNVFENKSNFKYKFKIYSLGF